MLIGIDLKLYTFFDSYLESSNLLFIAQLLFFNVTAITKTALLRHQGESAMRLRQAHSAIVDGASAAHFLLFLLNELLWSVGCSRKFITENKDLEMGLAGILLTTVVRAVQLTEGLPLKYMSMSSRVRPAVSG